MGKIAKGWRSYFEGRLPEDNERDGKAIAFSRDLVNSIWVFTLGVWKVHNEGIHGTQGRYSDRNIANLKQCVQEIHDILRVRVSTEDEWLFREEARIRVEQPVPQLMGWFERVLLLFGANSSEKFPVIAKTRHLLQRLCASSIYLLKKKLLCNVNI